MSSNSRKKKLSVNPAKNAAMLKERNEANNTDLKENAVSQSTDRTDTKHSNSTHSKKSKNAETNNLDKRTLKNWKLRRELKKALNSDQSSTSKSAASLNSDSENEENINKPSAKKKQKSKKASEEAAIDVQEELSQADEQEGATSPLIVEAIDDSIIVEEKILDKEQDLAPLPVERLKYEAHTKTAKFLKWFGHKFNIISKLKETAKSIARFWWGQAKKLNPTQIGFLIVSLVIVFAFVVPPVWSAIDFYRSGMWNLFG